MPDHLNRQQPTPPGTNGTHTEAGDTVVPLNLPKQRARIRIQRVETRPITPDEYRHAVTNLAALINQWKINNRNRSSDNGMAA